MTEEQINKTVEDLFDMIAQSGEADYIGEKVTQLEHMCQAAERAEAQGNDDELVLGALFHDIGHFCAEYGAEDDMGGLGHMNHDKVGADYLRDRGFSERIASIVENHVEAKRYLCVAKPGYHKKLSEASLKTLAFQGGPMSEEEVERFEADPYHKDYIKMRAWDELAKEENRPLPDIERYKLMAKNHLRSRHITN
jgi:phosphonate degradation associated HDIG domain protein